ncbi:MAG TPA: hypothetical protein VGE97_07325 [Nitrososphaera sp.]
MSSPKFWEMLENAYNLVATENGRTIRFQHNTQEAVVYHRSDNGLGQIVIEINEVDKPEGDALIAPGTQSHWKD